MERTLPVIDDRNRYYWEGARDHKLTLLRCCDCEYWIHPPRESCRRCLSERLEPRAAAGRGRVYSWSVMHSKGNPGFDDRLPYTVVVVELDEQAGLFMIGDLDGAGEGLEIGQPVEVTFETLTPEVTLPQWKPAAGEAVR